MHIIPQEDNWTVVLSDLLDQWKLPGYQSVLENADPMNPEEIVRFDVPVRQTTEPVENFSILFEGADTGSDATMFMAWDNQVIAFPVVVEVE